jgi:TolR protein
MAGALTPRKSPASGGRFTRTPSRPMADINVTPMVDVMLVLLVIFMITAPLLATGVNVDLPQTRSATLDDQQDPLAISVDRTGRIFVQDNEVELSTLATKLEAITKNNKDIRIFVRGDQAIQYGQVMTVLGAVYEAGYRKVALLTEQPKSDGKRPRTTASRGQP